MSSLVLHSLYICILVVSCAAVVHSTYIRVVHPEIQGYVKVHKEVATWDEAKTNCENEGAILASPVNPQLLKYIKSVIVTNNHTTPFFIGMNATLGGATSFVSQEGVLLENIPEALNLVEQLDSRNGDCLCMDGASIRVVQCWTRLPYICYIHNVTEKVVTTTEPPTTPVLPKDCNAGYNHNPKTGSYYKFYDESHAGSWEEVNNICIYDAATLAVLNSYAEAREVKKIAFPQGLIDYAFIYIGFRDWSGTNYWISNTGDVAENLFSVFESKKQSGSCGILKHTGQMEGYTCYDKLPFVCEKPELGPCLVYTNNSD